MFLFFKLDFGPSHCFPFQGWWFDHNWGWIWQCRNQNWMLLDNRIFSNCISSKLCNHLYLDVYHDFLDYQKFRLNHTKNFPHPNMYLWSMHPQEMLSLLYYYNFIAQWKIFRDNFMLSFQFIFYVLHLFFYNFFFTPKTDPFKLEESGIQFF